MPVQRIDEINRLLVDEDLDLLAFTGDAVDLDWKGIERFFEGMSAVPSRLGHYLVLGNHDRLDDPDSVVAAAREAGITVLLDEQVSVPVGDDGRLRIAGVDWTKRPQDCSERVAQVCDSARAEDPEAMVDLLLAQGVQRASVRGSPDPLRTHPRRARSRKPNRNLAVAHRLRRDSTSRTAACCS